MVISFFKKKLNLRFFYINVIAVVVFAFLYYLQDVIIFHNQDLAEKLHLLDNTHTPKSYSGKVSPLSYYLWFSLMTQTTVGYGGPANTVTGNSVSFFQEPNRVAKFINAMQMLSILFIVSVV